MKKTYISGTILLFCIIIMLGCTNMAGDVKGGIKPSVECGNNVLERGEDCDITDMGGETCESQGFENGGVLRCFSDCTFDTSYCVMPCVSHSCEACFKGICDYDCDPKKEGNDCSDCNDLLPCCGDGNCNAGEDEENCPADCYQQVTCTDTDGGINYYEFGSVKDYVDKQFYPDYCTLNGVEVDSCTNPNDNCGIFERYCEINNSRSGNYIAGSEFDIQCPNGCQYGTCVVAGCDSNYIQVCDADSDSDVDNIDFDIMLNLECGDDLSNLLAAPPELLAACDFDLDNCLTINEILGCCAVAMNSTCYESNECTDTDGVTELKSINEGTSDIIAGLNIEVINAQGNTISYYADLKINGTAMTLSSDSMPSNAYEPNYPYHKVRYLIELVSATDYSATLRVNSQIDYYERGMVTGLRSPVYEPGLEKGIISGEDSNKCSYRIDEILNYNIYYDCCKDSETSNTVHEVFCGSDGLIQVVGMACPYGCKDGACIYGTFCGDGVCDSGEWCENCPEDCGECGYYCDESDNGVDYFTKGTNVMVINYVPYHYTDYCINQNPNSSLLIEFFCNSDDQVINITQDCLMFNGSTCQDGACVAPHCDPNYLPICDADSDGDVDSLDLNIIESYECGNTPQELLDACDVNFDACLQQYEVWACCLSAMNSTCNLGYVCTDTDGGIEPYIYGEVDDGYPNLAKDFCVIHTGNGGYINRNYEGCFANETGCGVVEAFCGTDGLRDWNYDNYCPNGCQDGACIESVSCSSIILDNSTYYLEPCYMDVEMVDGQGDRYFNVTIVQEGRQMVFGVSVYGYGVGFPTYAILGTSSGGAQPGGISFPERFNDNVLDAGFYSGYLPIQIDHDSAGTGAQGWLNLSIDLTVLPG